MNIIVFTLAIFNAGLLFTGGEIAGGIGWILVALYALRDDK